LGGAASLMALTSVVSTSIPLFLEGLVDRVKAQTEGAADPRRSTVRRRFTWG
jgi:hypothetical protein